jgi:DNA helicase-2/ATP-dependent DNA helicase PcrA
MFLFSEGSQPKPPVRPNFELNERQREAGEHVSGPMLVVAGAGTGKTTVLTHRVANLIRQGHARPEEILAITYTDNAAAELVERVRKELGWKEDVPLKPATFHAFCLDILKRCGKDFGVVEPQDLWIYLRQRLPDLKLEYYTRAASPAQFLNALLDFFDNCHDELKSADDYERYVEQLIHTQHPLPRVTRSKDIDKLTPEQVIARCREIAHVFRTVENMLLADGLGTFAHMILGAMKVLKSDPAILEKERAGARFILVDEFQDCNIAQLELMQLVAGNSRNIFAVGDPDQAIYRFRGASSAAFEEFIQRFPETKAVVLDRNQRSRSPILNCAFSLISHNPPVGCALGRSAQPFERQSLSSEREKRAKAEQRGFNSEPVNMMLISDNDHEAQVVAESILQRRAAGNSSSAVLYRTHAHRELLVKELARRGIPFRVEGLNALESAELRDLMACLRALPVPADNASLFRVAAMECFRLDGIAVREAMFANKRLNMNEVLGRVPGGDTVLQKLEDVRREAAAANWNMKPVLEIVLQRFGFERTAPPVVAFCGFVHKWCEKKIVKTGVLDEFLQYMHCFPAAGGTVAYSQTQAAASGNPVLLMTVHAAKGLEFDHVYVIRGNSNSFPTNFKEKLFEMPTALRDPHCLAPSDGPQLHYEEERRLFYVAMTRARDSLTLCGRATKKQKRPSAFLREIEDAPTSKSSWRERTPEPEINLAAGAGVTNARGLGAWLLLPPSPRVNRPLSASAIEDYETCPMIYKIRHDWAIPGEIAGSLHYGAAVHDALKDFYDAALQERPRTQEQLLQIFESALAERHFDDQHQQEMYLNQGRKELGEFFLSAMHAPAPEVLSTERTFEMKVKGALIRGRVDRIDCIAGQRVSIVDYKTGTAKDEKVADKSLQLSIYALAASDLWGMIPERLVFYNLETNEAVETKRTDYQLNKAKEKIAEVAANIADGNFDPKPGYQCRGCRFRAMCPATVEQWYPSATAAKA